MGHLDQSPTEVDSSEILWGDGAIELLSIDSTITYFRPFLRGEDFIVVSDHASTIEISRL